MNNKEYKNISIIPLIRYTNADIDKHKIYEENKRKSGIYKWINLITNKSYVGSSKDLACRFSKYYSIKYIKNTLENGSSIIYSALLKYGYSKFSLDILEYCEPNILIEREQYYMDILKPEYNILKIAGSRLGNKPSEKTKKLISNSLKKYHLNNLNSNRKKKLLSIKVTNIVINTIKYFPTNLAAAKHLGISERTLGRYKSKGKILLKKYLITNDK